MGRQAIGQHHTKIFLTTILDWADVAARACALVATQPTEITCNFVITFGQWRVRLGLKLVDTGNQTGIILVRLRLRDTLRRGQGRHRVQDTCAWA